MTDETIAPILRHDWWRPYDRFPNLLRRTDRAGNLLEECKACTRMRPVDGSRDDEPCRGVIHVTLR